MLSLSKKIKFSFLLNILVFSIIFTPNVILAFVDIGIFSEQISNFLTVLPVLLSILYALIIYPQYFRFFYLEAIYFFIVLVYAMYGIYQGYSIIYIVKDLLILTIGPMAFLLGRICASIGTVSDQSFKLLCSSCGWIFFVLSPFVVAPVSHLLLFSKISHRRIVNFSSLAAIINLIQFSSKSVVLAIIYYFALKPLKIDSGKKNFKVIIICFLFIMLIAFFDIPFVRKANNFFDKIQDIDIVSVLRDADADSVWVFDISTAQRLYELKLVLQDSDFTNLLIGHGLGYAVSMEDGKDLSIAARTTETAIDSVRSFHLIFTWALGKVGFFGFVLILLFLKNVVNHCRSNSSLIIIFSLYAAYLTVTFGAFSLNYQYLFIIGFLGGGREIK